MVKNEKSKLRHIIERMEHLEESDKFLIVSFASLNKQRNLKLDQIAEKDWSKEVFAAKIPAMTNAILEEFGTSQELKDLKDLVVKSDVQYDRIKEIHDSASGHIRKISLRLFGRTTSVVLEEHKRNLLNLAKAKAKKAVEAAAEEEETSESEEESDESESRPKRVVKVSTKEEDTKSYSRPASKKRKANVPKDENGAVVMMFHEDPMVSPEICEEVKTHLDDCINLMLQTPAVSDDKCNHWDYDTVDAEGRVHRITYTILTEAFVKGSSKAFQTEVGKLMAKKCIDSEAIESTEEEISLEEAATSDEE
jgi:hypothetical protein